MKIENIDYVVCPICKKQFRRITTGHIRIHKINNIKEFLNLYPGQKIMCKNYIKKFSNSHKGKIISEKTRKKLKEINIGKKFSKKTRDKIGNKSKERWSNEKYRKRLSKKHKEIGSGKSNLGRKCSEKTRKKCRVSRIKNMRKNGNKFPGYNKNAVNYFKFFDYYWSTKGQYATNPHEHEVKELGYFLDYFNKNLKLIIEVDEKHHEKQKEKDEIREKEIQRLYSDFTFIRIEEEDIKKYYNELAVSRGL